jgi:hypothetical protein
MGRSKRTKKASKTFHSFPKLPPELRYKIWRDACIPFAKTKEGQHYIDLDSIKELWPGHRKKAIHGYSRDMGLWNACKESRDAISLHYHLDMWRKAQAQSPDSRDWMRECRKNLASQIDLRPGGPNSGDTAFFTAIFGSFDQQAGGINPTFDVIRIRTATPEALDSKLNRLNLYLPEVDSVKTLTLRKLSWVALDINSSWHENLPTARGPFEAEKSQRALFAKCVGAVWNGGFPDACSRLVLIEQSARVVSIGCGYKLEDGAARMLRPDSQRPNRSALKPFFQAVQWLFGLKCCRGGTSRCYRCAVGRPRWRSLPLVPYIVRKDNRQHDAEWAHELMEARNNPIGGAAAGDGSLV